MTSFSKKGLPRVSSGGVSWCVKLKLDVVHADPAQPLEVHRRDVGADEKPPLAERLARSPKIGPARCRGFGRNPPRTGRSRAARGRAYGVLDTLAAMITPADQGCRPRRLRRRDEVRAVAEGAHRRGTAARRSCEGEEIGADQIAQRLGGKEAGANRRATSRQRRTMTTPAVKGRGNDSRPCYDHTIPRPARESLRSRETQVPCLSPASVLRRRDTDGLATKGIGPRTSAAPHRGLAAVGLYPR